MKWGWYLFNLLIVDEWLTCVYNCSNFDFKRSFNLISKVKLCFMREGMLLQISSLAFFSPWTSKFIEFWEWLSISLFVALNRSKTDLQARVLQFCVKQVVFNLSNILIHDVEASMRSSTKTRNEEWSFLWFKLLPTSTVMYWELKALLLFLIHIWVGCSGV